MPSKSKITMNDGEEASSRLTTMRSTNDDSILIIVIVLAVIVFVISLVVVILVIVICKCMKKLMSNYLIKHEFLVGNHRRSKKRLVVSASIQHTFM